MKTKGRHWLMAMIYLGAPLAMPRHLDDGQELVLESLRLLQCPDRSSMNQTNWFISIHCHVYDISGWYFMCSSNGMCVWRNVEGKPGGMSCTLSKRDASLLTLLQCPDRSLMNQTNWFISIHCHVFIVPSSIFFCKGRCNWLFLLCYVDYLPCQGTTGPINTYHILWLPTTHESRISKGSIPPKVLH